MRIRTTSPSRTATPAALSADFEVSRGDDLAGLHPPDAPGRRDIQQHAAGEEHADVLDAQLLEAVGGAELRAAEAVVEVIVVADADAHVPQAVELGADLADLAAEEIVVIDALILTRRPAGRRSRYRQAEVPLARQRHAMLVDAAERVDLALADQSGGLLDMRGGQPVGRAALIGRAPLRRPPLRPDRRLRPVVARPAPRETQDRQADRQSERERRPDLHGEDLRGVWSRPRACSMTAEAVFFKRLAVGPSNPTRHETSDVPA